MIKGILLAAFAGCCWGSMGVAAQYLFKNSGFTPEDLTPLRLVGAGLLLLLFTFFVERKDIFSPLKEKKNLIPIVIYGITLLLIQYTFFVAIHVSNAGTAAIMLGFGPLFIIFYYVLFKNRRPTWKEIFCLLLAMLGILLIVTKGRFDTLELSWQGAFWGLVSSAFGSFGTVQPRNVISRVGVSTVIGWGMIIGGLASALFINPIPKAVVWTPMVFACYFYIILFGTVIAFWCYLKSTEYILPSVTAILASFEPLSAVFLSFVLLGTMFNGAELLGMAAILSNMIILAWPSKQKITN